MGIDLATWRARIGLYYYRICHPRGIKWKSGHRHLYKPGVAHWGMWEVMSLILQHVVYAWSKPKGRCGGGKTRCHWQGATSQVRDIVNGEVTLALSSLVVVVSLLLVIAGDVELNPGPGGILLCTTVSLP